MKKTVAALLVLGSSTALAGTMGPVCTPGAVTVPCETNAWDVGIYALYLQPTYDANLGYTGNYVNANAHTQYRDWDADWGWGFKLEGSYHFSTGNDFNVNWTHYQKTSSGDFMFGNVANPWNSRISNKSQWDAVNFEFGQFVDFGESKNIRFHGGAQYVSLKNTQKNSNFLNNNVRSNGTSKFTGFGPRGGADFAYDWGSGFQMYANTAAALLVGSSKADFSTTMPGSISGSKDAVVPELEAKLGAKYDYAMAQGMLTLDAGWMFVNYFNANHVLPVAGAPFESDVAFNGPYFGMKWVGNA